MPKKPSTRLVMQAYRRLPSRRYVKLNVKSVSRPSKEFIRFEFGILDDSRQAGRTVVHDLPALLAPSSPLQTFLADGFDIRLATGQSVDLATLVGRVVRARFSKPKNGNEQALMAIRPHQETNEKNPVSPCGGSYAIPGRPLARRSAHRALSAPSSTSCADHTRNRKCRVRSSGRQL